MITPAVRPLVRLVPFEPDDGQVLMTPGGDEGGHWIGCPSVLYESDRDRFVMTYRQRSPRGADVERGWRCAVAVSQDGRNFRDVWAVHKAELQTSSMERFAVVPREAGGYLLYLSYVDPADGRWRIDAVAAPEVDAFDVTERVAVLTAKSTGTEGVKDPYPMRVGPATYLFASYAKAGLSENQLASAHATADIYTTGVTTFPTGLGISQDGFNFAWRPDALPVGTTWDAYQTRLTTVVPQDSGAFLAAYDGSADASENYEERAGLAISFDLRTWTSLTPSEPWMVSKHATGAMRYLDVVPVGSQWFVYYETARADGAHELRLFRTPIA